MSGCNIAEPTNRALSSIRVKPRIWVKAQDDLGEALDLGEAQRILLEESSSDEREDVWPIAPTPRS